MKDSGDNPKPLILIVDDIPKNLQVLGNILNREKKYRIAIATGGKQALTMANNISPDLILLDIVMPECNGFEVCKTIKTGEKNADVPIIFLTAKTETEDIVQGFELGAVDYITKPFNSTELLARVNNHLALKQARDMQKKLISELQQALGQVKLLSGLLPICSHCKKIRDDKGYWQQVEEYIKQHSQAVFSHGICPGCLKEHYPEFAPKIMENLEKKNKDRKSTTPT